ncbi:Malto-oligosyltrehalose trehalohydrolase [compost metagenome]
MRDFFIENALMWLLEYRFDGLRLDAVHAIESPDFLQELAQRVREQTDPARHVWLTLENEHNQASLLQEGFDAQWNDDGHNALHVLLTGETDAYYATSPATGHPAENPAAICRPVLLCCFCKTTTRSAIAPLANACIN